MALFRGPNIVRSGLVLALDAADKNSYRGSGTTWTDVSGTSKIAVLVNGPTFSNINGGTIYFDGNANYCAISPSANFEWTPSGSGLNNMTLDLWVKTSDTAGYLFSKPWNGSGEYNYYAYHNGFYMQIASQAATFSFTSISTNTWKNLVIVVSSTQFGSYTNGVLSTSFTNHGITTNTPSFGNTGAELALMTLYPYGAGTWSGNTSFSIQGNVGAYKIYNRTLTATEVLQNYNATKTRFGL